MLNYQRVPFGTQLKHGTKWVISHSKLFDNQSDTPRIFASRVGRGVRPGHRFCFFCALATTVPFGTDEKWVKHMEFVWNWGIQKQFFHWTWWRNMPFWATEGKPPVGDTLEHLFLCGLWFISGGVYSSTSPFGLHLLGLVCYPSDHGPRRGGERRKHQERCGAGRSKHSFLCGDVEHFLSLGTWGETLHNWKVL